MGFFMKFIVYFSVWFSSLMYPFLFGVQAKVKSMSAPEIPGYIFHIVSTDRLIDDDCH